MFFLFSAVVFCSVSFWLFFSLFFVFFFVCCFRLGLFRIMCFDSLCLLCIALLVWMLSVAYIFGVTTLTVRTKCVYIIRTFNRSLPFLGLCFILYLSVFFFHCLYMYARVACVCTVWFEYFVANSNESESLSLAIETKIEDSFFLLLCISLVSFSLHIITFALISCVRVCFFLISIQISYGFWSFWI